MKTKLAWQFSPPLAALETVEFRATLDAVHPQHGLQIAIAAAPIAGRFLQLDFSPGALPQDEELFESYVRHEDFVATYLETPTRPFRPQVYWRAVQSPEPSSLVGVEVIVSVQTSLLDARPAIDAATTLTTEEVWSPIDFGLENFTRIDLAAQTPWRLKSSEAPACLVYRLPQQRLSYVELVLPTDFDVLHLALELDGAVRLRYPLFARFLEKGVILRARRRGVFVSRSDDLQAAAACYRAFVQSELPLTA